MKAGDKRQVLVLSIVAVLAVGFLITQLLPRRSPALRADNGESPAASAPSQVLDMPTEVFGNPFSHPKLAPEKEKEEEQPDGEEGTVDPWRVELEGLIPGSAQYVAKKHTLEKLRDAEENTGDSRKEEKGPFRLKLTGIVRAEDPVAFIEVRNEAHKPFRVGDELEEGVKLLSIGDGAVVVLVETEQLKLLVGEEAK